MKKIKVMVILILMICSLFTACGNSDTEVNKDKDNSNVNIVEMKNYNKTFDNIIFDTEIIVDKKDKNKPFFSSSASPQKVDNKKVFDVFFSDKEIKEKHEGECENEKGEPSKEISYMATDGSSLQMGPLLSMFSFSNKSLGNYVNYSFRLMQGDELYNGNKYSMDKEFDFATKEQAFNDIKKKLALVGLNIDDNYKAYALDYETMKNEQYSINKDGTENKSAYKDSWTKEDNCYYFIIRQKYDQLYEYHLFYNKIKRYEDYNAPIKVLYSKNGIEQLLVEQVFNFNKGNKEVCLASFDKVAKSVVNNYGNIIGETSYKVTKAELTYMVDTSVGKGSYLVNPVWILNIQELKHSKEEIRNYQIVIDAIKAKVIL